jgi:hypothetical protein
MREQWMDTNILLNGMQTRNLAAKRAAQDNQNMNQQFTGHPMFQDPFDMPYDDGLYDDAYEQPYDLRPEQFEDDVFYHQGAMRGPVMQFHPDDQFSPLDDRPREYLWDQQHPGYINAPPPPMPLHQDDYGMYQPIQDHEQQIGHADFPEPAYQQLPGYPVDNIDASRLPTPRTAGRFDMQPMEPMEPMLTAYLPPDPEPDAVAYGYPPLESPFRTQQGDLDQVYPFSDPMADKYGTSGRPADIIAGRWAQQVGQFGNDNSINPEYEQDNAPLPAFATEAKSSKQQADQTNNWFPPVDNNILPSEGIDFGEQPRLFNEIWEQEPPILPLDPDMEDYQQAVREQDEMQMLTAR